MSKTNVKKCSLPINNKYIYYDIHHLNYAEDKFTNT